MNNNKNTSTEHIQVVNSSWQRCDLYGLNHTSEADYSTMPTGEIKDLQAEHRYLLGTTDREVLPYYENILANSSCLIMLTDQRGQVLNCWGDKRFINKEQQHALAEGTHWSERINGTNAIGTAIATGQAVQIQRDEHYLKHNRFMIGSAAPIYDTNNQLLAVLDVSSDAYLPQAHTFGMVKMMSQSVENRLIHSKFSDDHFLMSFNTSNNNLDSQWIGLIAFNENGSIISANKRAEMLLRFELALKNVEDIFGCPLFELKNQPKGQPIAVVALNKYTMYATIQRPLKGYMAAPDYRERQPVRQESRPQPGQESDAKISKIKISYGDPQVDRSLKMATAIFEKDIPILLQGETGAGKEEFCKALHDSSNRHQHPFITINCAAISEQTIEAELFGYDSDDPDSIGLIRKADKGILFLDEISEIPLSVQSKFLRVFEEKKISPLGSNRAVPVDIKIMSSSKRDLKKLTENGLFRDDLYFRISGLNIQLPALKDRTDKHELIQNIHSHLCEGQQPEGLSEEVVILLANHPWPGNFRQLKNVILIALSMAGDDSVQPWHLPDDFFNDSDEHKNSEKTKRSTPVAGYSQSIINASSVRILAENNVNQDTLREYNLNKGNISRTARALSISRNTLYKRLKSIGIRL
ncbi:sigma-54-dependent Fis family transcriptional regulator [Neptunomonas antarctica]|uniref:GAF modulated sigma54 specific transcriptional regulator, Fis family n=1 Tax=Neptunomonas antarctica TaxID=619304 RepID=A0A1N7KZ81_9GAMM|nr:sigma-54-dependent Fis family transcriptional regulator [Neptunomonas antarctica]SIS66893.1 GAF modulated sigma54 specific transcriptional regulator, Fis family [Neptunomonas antarctica]